jgi:hypothetical protein
MQDKALQEHNNLLAKKVMTYFSFLLVFVGI